MLYCFQPTKLVIFDETRKTKDEKLPPFVVMGLQAVCKYQLNGFSR